MPFQKIQTEKLSQSVVRQIELLILRGVLKPGERLPSERDLAERLGVSRPSLREALAELEDKALLSTQPGAGVFVAEALGSAFSEPLTQLFARHAEALSYYLSFSRELEGMAAQRAATKASETDLMLIDTLFTKMTTASHHRNPEVEAALDAEFHLAIIEASHNVIMVHMMRSMFELLRRGVFYNRKVMFSQKTTRSALLDQHRAINQALQQRDAIAARKTVERHLDFVETAMNQQRQAELHEAVAMQRLEREKQR